MKQKPKKNNTKLNKKLELEWIISHTGADLGV